MRLLCSQCQSVSDTNLIGGDQIRSKTCFTSACSRYQFSNFLTTDRNNQTLKWFAGCSRDSDIGRKRVRRRKETWLQQKRGKSKGLSGCQMHRNQGRRLVWQKEHATFCCEKLCSGRRTISWMSLSFCCTSISLPWDLPLHSVVTSKNVRSSKGSIKEFYYTLFLVKVRCIDSLGLTFSSLFSCLTFIFFVFFFETSFFMLLKKQAGNSASFVQHHHSSFRSSILYVTVVPKMMPLLLSRILPVCSAWSFL